MLGIVSTIAGLVVLVSWVLLLRGNNNGYAADYDSKPTPASQRYQAGASSWEEEGMQAGSGFAPAVA